MNTRSKKTDGPKVLREMFEECGAGRWEAAAIARVNTVEEVVVGDVPQIVTQGVHQLNSEDLMRLISRDEIVSRYPVQPEGREFEDKVFSGTHVIEYLAPFPSGIVSSGEWPGQTLINHFLLGLTGSGYRAFHQHINPPHDAIGTLFGGEKLWVFRAPGSRDTERLVRAGQSTTMEEIQSKMRSKDGKRFFVGIRREGETYTSPMVGLTVSSQTARRGSRVGSLCPSCQSKKMNCKKGTRSYRTMLLWESEGVMLLVHPDD